MTLLAKHGDTVSLRIEEILHGGLPLAPGDVIEGSRYDDEFACHLGCAAVDVGEEAFALYTPEAPALPPCGARQACIATCDAENMVAEAYQSACACRQPETTSLGSVSGTPTCGVPIFDRGRDCREECEQETADICPPRPEQDYKRGSVGLSPWKDPIVFARSELGELSIPIAEIGALLAWSSDDPAVPAYTPACREQFGDWSDYRTGSEY